MSAYPVEPVLRRPAPSEASARLADRVEGAAERLGVVAEEVVRLLEGLAASTPAGATSPASTLTVEEERVLRAAGSLRHDMPPLDQRASSHAAAGRLQLLGGALTVKAAASALGVSESRIRQRIAKRTLLAVQGTAGWVLPTFQFDEGRELPGLDRVLPALPSDVHPAVVARFLRTPHPDLDMDGEAVAPADWMATGGNVDVVVAVAADLHRVP